MGCTKGYCMDSYKTLDTRSINYQINEQANSGLQKDKGTVSMHETIQFCLRYLCS